MDYEMAAPPTIRHLSPPRSPHPPSPLSISFCPKPAGEVPPKPHPDHVDSPSPLTWHDADSASPLPRAAPLCGNHENRLRCGLDALLAAAVAPAPTRISRQHGGARPWQVCWTVLGTQVGKARHRTDSYLSLGLARWACHWGQEHRPPEGWEVEAIAQGRKKTAADPGTRPHQLTILYAPFTELRSTAPLQAACPKACLGLAHTSLNTGNVTSALPTEGLLMVKIFLLHLFLHEWICRTSCSVLDFLLYLKSLRPKVR
ncbi:uncharacterized protein LOC128150658 [Harpia harpyja]|uniref:uncharacterized protein LOC128150658 n=1 Tax=Harpia harpyja TaxID=202280 RepID=UPI0022B1ECA0|nr:uncharacterized protein LOC128150658 [Harpia harpyja]